MLTLYTEIILSTETDLIIIIMNCGLTQYCHIIIMELIGGVTRRRWEKSRNGIVLFVRDTQCAVSTGYYLSKSSAEPFTLSQCHCLLAPAKIET